MRRVAILGVATLLTYLLTEVVSFIGLEALQRFKGLRVVGEPPALTAQNERALKQLIDSGKGRYVDIDPELGWSPRPGSRRTKLPDSINSAGMRDDREYSATPSPDRVRIAAFGESFTYGAEVALGENWAKQLSAMEPAVEVLNYGVGGYGLDQAYLRYLKLGRQYHPDIVLIGYMSENMARSVSVYRPFLVPEGGGIFSKPRFFLDDGKLVLLENPLRTIEDYRTLMESPAERLAELGQYDAHYRAKHNPSVWNFSPTVRLIKSLQVQLEPEALVWRNDEGICAPETEAFQVTLEIMQAFYRQVLENGQLPVIVVFPYVYDFWRAYRGESLHYEPFLQALSSEGLQYIDTFNAFLPIKSPQQIETLMGGHFTPEGNQVVAGYLLDYLRARNLLSRKDVRKAVTAEKKKLGLKIGVEPASP